MQVKGNKKKKRQTKENSRQLKTRMIKANFSIYFKLLILSDEKVPIQF